MDDEIVVITDHIPAGDYRLQETVLGYKPYIGVTLDPDTEEVTVTLAGIETVGIPILLEFVSGLLDSLELRKEDR